MTAEEALKIRNNPTANNCDCEELGRCIDDALQKQVPKKPKKEKLSRYSIANICPTCGEVVLEPIYIGEEVYDYCPYCGQKLDWR